ncbi:unnamed protein product [Rotaria socialis]|uniref:Uncharacterized protein n=1 Tax=Rotaria socialis TaxID=392032 RepID=A0A817ZB27_9BILA|nr:unnamed protein product [Rotaria socialis]CAF3558070.1 unnamed protein product [Rotaria socialis]CAF3618499.1 unnamed protein product [Rotaria socialis]CAF4467873.1 unnamed protein product [Rotaria socialis]CAF4497653.1 unnamed protein product [Rotaria socialis]
MVCATAAAVTIIATGGAAIPILLSSGTTGLAAGGTATGVATTAGASVATAVGASTAAGAAAGTISAAGAGSAIVTAAGTATGAASGTAISSIIGGVISGPVGWVVLGCSEDKSTGLYTFDCWKPIVHDDSIEPSNGKFLCDIVADSRIKKVTTQNNSDGNLSQFVLENIWNESFNIEFFYLMPKKQLVAHAYKT